MALLDPIHPLQSSVLEILSTERGVTVQELHSKVVTTGTEVSLKNLYRLVGQLIDHQLLVRTNGQLFLNHVWLTQLLQFTNTARQTYLAAELVAVSLPTKDGDKRTYNGSSLQALDPVWNDLLMQLAEVTRCREWYAYNSHPWYSLGMRDTETRLYKALVAKEVHAHMLYGNDNFLDRYGDRAIKVKGFRTKIEPTPTLPAEGYALWVDGEFFIESIMPDSIANLFAFYFRSVQSIESFDAQLFSDIFRMRASCSVTVTRNRARSKAYHAKLKKLFAA